MSRINGVIGVVRPVVRGLTSNKGVGVDARYGIDIFAARSVGQTRFRNGLRSSSSLTDIATVTRATTAWGVDQAGVLSSFAAGVPVVNTAGLAVWEARTNFVKASGDLTNATYWTQTNVGLAATADPLGGSAASTITAAAGSTAHYVETVGGQAATETAGQVYSHSTFVKPGTAPYAVLGQKGDSPWIWATLKWSDLTLSVQGCAAVLDPQIYTGGYRKVTFTYTRTTTGLNNHVVGPGPSTAASVGNTNYTFNAAGTESVGAFGLQGELGGFASPYIPTTTAPVTCNADVITEAVNIPVGQAFTITCKCIAPTAAVLTGYPRVFSISDTGDSSAVNIIELMLTGPSAYMRPKSGAGTLIDVNVGPGLVAAGAPVGIALSVNGATVTTSVNGAAPVTHTMAGGPFSAAILKLHLGRAFNIPSTYFLNSTIRDLNIVMRAYSAAELRAASDVSLTHDIDFTAQSYKYVGDPYLAVTDLPMTTFTRPSDGYGVTASGRLVLFGAGVPRATDAGLTVEPAATNYTRASGDMTNTSYWTSTGVTRTGGQADPLGGTAGVSLLATAGTAPRRVTQNGTSAATETAGGVYSHSFLVKQGTAPYALVGQQGDTPWIWATLKWSDLSLSAQACTAVLDPVVYAGGYRRVTITYTRIATNLSHPTVGPALTTAALIGNTDYGPTWAGTETVVAFGAQGESGSFATSYIPTTTAAATRNADLLASADTVISPTIVAEFTVPLNGPTTGYPRVFSWNDGTSNNNIEIYLDRVNLDLYASVFGGGVEQASSFLGSVALGSTHKVAMRIAANDWAVSRNGGAVLTDASVTLPALTIFRVADDHTLSRQWGAGIRRLRRYSTPKTNAELQALSA